MLASASGTADVSPATTSGSVRSSRRKSRNALASAFAGGSALSAASSSSNTATPLAATFCGRGSVVQSVPGGTTGVPGGPSSL